jgi:hypothetical protein
MVELETEPRCSPHGSQGTGREEGAREDVPFKVTPTSDHVLQPALASYQPTQ